jgi:protein-disulfide isomerase
MNKLKWIIFAGIVVAIFGGIIWVGKSNTKDYAGDATKIITDGPIADHVTGPTPPKITFIEYGDYQCPGCGHMYQTVKDLTTKYPDKLTFVFRNMPLTNLHPNALAAATAAEAAGLQGKYFEMHDMLYQTQSQWSTAGISDRSTIFQNFAGQLGLNVDKFKQDSASDSILAKINRDISTGKKQFSVDATPTFVLDGKKVDANVAVDPGALTKLVDDAIAKAYPKQ